MGIRRINALFARVQQQLTVNGPPLHRPIILSALRIPRISSRTCLCFLHLSPPFPTSRQAGTLPGLTAQLLESVVLSGEQARRRCPTLRQRAGLVCVGLLLQVIENPLDHHRVFDADNDLHRPAAGRTGLNVDAKDAFQALRPEPAPDLIRGHGGPALSRPA